MSDFMSDYFADTQHTLDRLCQVLARVGVRHADVPNVMGRSIAVWYGDAKIVIVSVGGPPNHNNAYILAPVLKDVGHHARPALLELCNQLTRDNPAVPTFLHDAEAGWAVLASISLPAQILVDVPPFFQMLLESLPAVAEQSRAEFRQIGVGGTEYAWTPADLEQLALRSVA